MSDPDTIRAAFANQVDYCRANDAPMTARVVEALEIALDRSSDFGARVLGWAGDPLADALPLRCAAGLHALHQCGSDPATGRLYERAFVNIEESSAIVANIIAAHQDFLLPWLDGPPQTNEVGRSSNYVAALLWLAEQGLPARFDLNEIGSSAGANLMLDRYRYDLGGVAVGSADAALAFAPQWRGEPPPDIGFEIVSAKGCDVAPIDLLDKAAVARLLAYIWPDHPTRFERLEGVVTEARKHAPHLDCADAADFVDAMLAQPQAPSTTRVLMHSIVWQYVGAKSRERITAAMEDAGSRATAEKPLAWIMLEADRDNFRHELRVKYWLGGAEWALLGTSHAHGDWIDWAGK